MPNDTPNMLRMADVPLNTVGRITRPAVIRALGGRASAWNRDNRPFVTVFSGSRAGKNAALMREVAEIGRMIDQQGGVVVNGGTSKGLMGAILERASRQVCLIPELFANPASGAGVPIEGLHNGSASRILPDFFERKALMTVIASGGFLTLPGGFGTLDEAFEAIIFAQKTKTPVVFYGSNDFWGPAIEQLEAFHRYGLMPRSYLDVVYVADKPEAAINLLTDNRAVSLAARQTQGQPPKPTQSLRSFLSENLNFLPRLIHDFSGNAPRIGVIASGNIGQRHASDMNPKDRSFVGAMASNARAIAREFAQAGATLVIAGSRQGVRFAMADEAIRNGGRVIWLQKGATQAPMTVKHEAERDITITVPRFYERARLFATLSQGQCTIAGGIHTANEMLSHLTRNQTGHGGYCDLVPELCDTQGPRIVMHAYDPPLNGDRCGLWHYMRLQFSRCRREGFMGERDIGLYRAHSKPATLVQGVMQELPAAPDITALMAVAARGGQGKRAAEIR